MQLFSSSLCRCIILAAIILQIAESILGDLKCNGTTSFIKVSSYVPDTNYLIPLFLSQQHPVTAECLQRCNVSVDCVGVVIDYDSYSCYRVSNASLNSAFYTKEYQHYANKRNYFYKTCFQTVPQTCKMKKWLFEVTPNFELVGFDKLTYIDIPTREECMLKCLQESKFTCRSAEYTHFAKRCVLSNQDRRSQANSYRASPSNVEYLENQCIDATSDKPCSFAEYVNKSIDYRDIEVAVNNITQCMNKCESNLNFICRAFTYISQSSASRLPVCWLHSDDTYSVGPQALRAFPGAIYMERVPCLDLSVTCSPDYINVTLRTVEPFRGRMYVNGRADICDAEGKGEYVTTLAIPTTVRNGRQPYNKCRILLARSVGMTNRTLMSTVVVVQYNPIIQRRGDRAVKIGCILDGAYPQNKAVNATLTFGGTDNLTPGGTIVVNTTATPPTVYVHIVDVGTGNNDTKETQLGQELEFRIDVIPDDGPFDIKATHVVATNEDGTSSYLLIDDRGCPPEPLTFPAFRKVRPGSRSLVSYFRAFKFPNSPVVRFNVMVQFCPDTCPVVNCESNRRIYRRRRDSLETNATLYEEMPMETILKVNTPPLVPGSLISTEEDANGKIIISLAGEAGSICIYYGAIIGLVIAWLLLQFFILIGCYFVVRYHYKKRRDDDTNSMVHKLQDDFQGYDNHRHVRWADQDS